MREFKGQISMGNGDESLGQIYKLLKRVDEGCSILCGLQQMESPMAFSICENTKHLEDDIKEAHKELQDIVQDVSIALRGRKIKMKVINGTTDRC